MSNLYEVTGTYGSQYTPCTVFVYEDGRGLKWYCVEDSVNVNATYEDIENGVNVEELHDVDAFTAGSPIGDLDMLEIAVDE